MNLGQYLSAGTPLVAGLAGPPDVHDLDGQLVSRAERLVRHCGPFEQAGEVRVAARSDHELGGAGLAGGPDQAGIRVAGPDYAQRPTSSPSSRRSSFSRARSGWSRLSIAVTCTPLSLAPESPAR